MRMQKGKQYFALFAALLLSLGNTGMTEALAKKDDSAPEGMDLALSNDYLELYVDEDEATIAVKDLASGEIWYSAPVDGDDSDATKYYKQLMKAQLTVQYYNESVQSSRMDSYADCVENEQFVIDCTDDEMTITFTIGDAGTSLLLPVAISEDRMILFMEKMTEKQLKKINRNYTLLSLDEMDEEEKEENLALYPGLETYNLYVLRGNVKDYMKEELTEYFQEAGYTKEDYELDLAELGDTEEVSAPWFTIPVTYRLEEDSLAISVDPSAVTYNTDFYLTNISLLPYFGAAGMEEEGYILVPDGSGALINLNNGKTAGNVSSYETLVYGQDKTMLMLSDKKSEIDENLTIKLPVYGMKAGDKAWFAIIENGDAYASVAADVSGRTTPYNHVYTKFTYLESGGISLGDMVGSNSMQMYSLPQFPEEYTMRYYFNAGEDADYSWMAGCYREYLEENGVLTRLEDDDTVPFYAEYIGAIDKYETILGIRYRDAKSVTTFAQAEEITGQLAENGVEDITVVYSGWANGGLEGTAATKLSLVSGLKRGGTSLDEFMTHMKEQQIPVYMTVDYQNVYKDKMFDGYSAMKYAPRYFDRTVVKAATYLVANGSVDERNINLISPYYVGQIAEDSLVSLRKNNIDAVNVTGLASVLYTDMLEEQYMDAQDAVNANSSVMAMLSEKLEGGIMGDNANVYAFAYLNDIINAPMSSNNYNIIDAEIPFYQMVIHGYMNYAGDAINLSDDYRTSILKCLESGAGLYFKWIYADNSVLKETDFDHLYSVCYDAWIDKAIESWKEINAVNGSLQDQEIQKHEILATDVVRVTYEDGTRIWINYSGKEVTLDGVTVAAKDYTVEKGGE